MAEPRSRVYHRNRVAETLREEIGTMLEGQLSDPRIAFCYVTEVAMNPGSKSARVYIAVDGGEDLRDDRGLPVYALADGEDQPLEDHGEGG